MAEVLGQARELEKGFEAIRKHLEVKPVDVEAARSLAMWLVLQGQREAGLELLRKETARHPEGDLILETLVGLLEPKTDAAESLRLAHPREQAAALAPVERQIRGSTLLEPGQTKRGRTHLHAAPRCWILRRDFRRGAGAKADPPVSPCSQALV